MYAQATLAQIAEALADGDLSPADAVALLEARAARKPEGSYAQRRALNAAAQIAETGGLDSARAFAESKSAKAKAAKAPKATKARKSRKPAAGLTPEEQAEIGALCRALAAADPAQVAAIAAFLRVK